MISAAAATGGLGAAAAVLEALAEPVAAKEPAVEVGFGAAVPVAIAAAAAASPPREAMGALFAAVGGRGDENNVVRRRFREREAVVCAHVSLRVCRRIQEERVSSENGGGDQIRFMNPWRRYASGGGDRWIRPTRPANTAPSSMPLR